MQSWSPAEALHTSQGESSVGAHKSEFEKTILCQCGIWLMSGHC